MKAILEDRDGFKKIVEVTKIPPPVYKIAVVKSLRTTWRLDDDFVAGSVLAVKFYLSAVVDNVAYYKER